ncbi:MAG: tetratricopeptide repeat protein [Gemmataceae bacterium]
MRTPARWKLALLSLVGVGVAGLGGWSVSTWVRFWRHDQAARQALERRDFAEASEELRQGLALMPGQAATLVLAAQAARRGGDLAQANRYLEAAQKAGSIPEAITLERQLGRFQSGELADAERPLALAGEHPDNPQAALVLEAVIVGALQAMQLDMAGRAIALWLEHRKTDVEQAQGLVWRGELALRRGNGEAALVAFREALKLDPTSEAAHRHAAEILVRYEPRDARVHLDWLRNRLPRDRNLRLLQARCHRALGEAEAARQLLEALLAERPNEAQYLLERGQVELDLGRAGEAEPWLRRAVERAPQLRDPNAALARCLRQLGKAEAAEYEQRTARIDAEIQAKIDQLFPNKKEPK